MILGLLIKLINTVHATLSACLLTIAGQGYNDSTTRVINYWGWRACRIKPAYPPQTVTVPKVGRPHSRSGPLSMGGGTVGGSWKRASGASQQLETVGFGWLWQNDRGSESDRERREDSSQRWKKQNLRGERANSSTETLLKVQFYWKGCFVIPLYRNLLVSFLVLYIVPIALLSPSHAHCSTPEYIRHCNITNHCICNPVQFPATDAPLRAKMIHSEPPFATCNVC